MIGVAAELVMGDEFQEMYQETAQRLSEKENEMGIFDRIKKQEKRTLLDEIHDFADPLIVSTYRKLGEAVGKPPTTKTSDQEILEVYQRVGSAFQSASFERNEILPAGHMNTIVFGMLQVYEAKGEYWFNKVLKFEVDNHIKNGLREDYKKNLQLF